MTDDANQEEQNLEQTPNELEAVTNNWKRALADFENYKRRKEAENKELVEFAREVTVVKLLPTLDSLAQALKHMPVFGDKGPETSSEFEKQYKNWQMGVKGIIIQLDQVLGELGVKKIPIEINITKFDPNLHEAVRYVQIANGDDDAKIVDELQAGYELNGKVIRPSQVVINKHA